MFLIIISRLKNLNLDSIGFSASFLCALHCAALPLILTGLSASSLGFLANPLVEIAMILLSIVVGIASLIPSYKKHRKLNAISLLLIGFFLIFSGHFLVLEHYEPIIIPIGALTVAMAHVTNWRSSKACDHCEIHPAHSIEEIV